MRRFFSAYGAVVVYFFGGRPGGAGVQDGRPPQRESIAESATISSRRTLTSAVFAFAELASLTRATDVVRSWAGQ